MSTLKETETFTAIVLPGDTKVRELTPEGIAEHVNLAPLPGIIVFGRHKDCARMLRFAEPQERTELFDALKLPQVTVLPVTKTSSWLCLPANRNQYEKRVDTYSPFFIKAKAPLPLLFETQALSMFDPVLARVYKQRRTWLIYEDINERFPTAQIEMLRTAFTYMQKMGSFQREVTIARAQVQPKFALPKDLLAALEVAVATTERPIETMVKYALKLASAKLVKLEDLGSGQYRVNYHYKDYDDSVVIDDRLTVISSGICLSGRDREQDLTSVVFVKDKRDEAHDYDD
jgi:hypothetical protein